jgi:hypothetical protein
MSHYFYMIVIQIAGLGKYALRLPSGEGPQLVEAAYRESHHRRLQHPSHLGPHELLPTCVCPSRHGSGWCATIQIPTSCSRYASVPARIPLASVFVATTLTSPPNNVTAR